MLLPLGVALNGTSSALYATVADLVTPERRARAYGLYYTLVVGASAVAPLVYGALGDAIGILASLLVTSAVVLVTVPLCLVLRGALAPSEERPARRLRRPRTGRRRHHGDREDVMLSTGLGLAVLRVTLGVIFLMHGYLAVRRDRAGRRRRLHDPHGVPRRARRGPRVVPHRGPRPWAGSC